MAVFASFNRSQAHRFDQNSIASFATFRIESHTRDLWETESDDDIPQRPKLKTFFEKRRQVLTSSPCRVTPTRPTTSSAATSASTASEAIHKSAAIAKPPNWSSPTSHVAYISSSAPTRPHTYLMCDDDHRLHQCTSSSFHFDFQLSIHERIVKVDEWRICENCFGSHSLLHCTSKYKCRSLKVSHHTTFHEIRESTERFHNYPVEKSESTATSILIDLTASTETSSGLSLNDTQRVSPEIQRDEFFSNIRFHHVRGEDNPADTISRGSTDITHNQLWCLRPEFITCDEKIWPSSIVEIDTEHPNFTSKFTQAIIEDHNDFNGFASEHFLIGHSLAAKSDRELIDVPLTRLERWDCIIQAHLHSLHRWSQDYHQLQVRTQNNTKASATAGQLLLVHVDSISSLQWHIALSINSGSNMKDPDNQREARAPSQQIGSLARHRTCNRRRGVCSSTSRLLIN
jgi:hypothetical protein